MSQKKADISEEELLELNRKVLDKAHARSKRWFLPYIIALVITLGQHLIFTNAYITIVILIIGIIIAWHKTSHFLNPRIIVFAESDPREPVLLFIGYLKLEGKKDIAYGIGSSIWYKYRAIMLEDRSCAIGYNTSQDSHGVIVTTDKQNYSKDFNYIAQRAKRIILILDNSRDSIRALEIINKAHLQKRTIIMMMPEIENGWKKLREEIKSKGFNLPHFNPDGMCYIPKNDFSICKSQIFEDGSFDNRNFFRFLEKVEDDNDGFSIIDCIPNEQYNSFIDSFFFSDISIIPNRSLFVDNFIQSLTFSDPELNLFYVEEQLRKLIIAPEENVEAIDGLISSFKKEKESDALLYIVKNMETISNVQKNNFITVLERRGLCLEDES